MADAAATMRQVATPVWPDRYPYPVASLPRTWVPATSAAGRPRRTTRLTTLAKAQVAVAPTTIRVANSRRPAHQATPPSAGPAPRAPSCITTQTGGWMASGSSLTGRKSASSHRFGPPVAAAIADVPSTARPLVDWRHEHIEDPSDQEAETGAADHIEGV